MKFNSTKYFLAFILCMTLASYAIYRYIDGVSQNIANDDGASSLADVSRTIAKKIRYADKHGNFSASDFEYLDFLNGDPERGWWSPQAKNPPRLDSKSDEIFPIGSREQKEIDFALQKMTINGQGKIFINIRRFPSKIGKSFDTLALVVTDVKNEFCASREKIEVSQLEIPSNNFTITQDGQPLYDCVEYKEKYYYIEQIASRFQSSETGQWRLEQGYVAQPLVPENKFLGIFENDE